MKELSISTIIRLILLIGLLSLFFACSSSSNKKEASIKDEWAIPAQYQNVPIEQIKSQIEITNYKTMKGSATDAGTEAMDSSGSIYSQGNQTSIVPGGAAVPVETPKNKADRKALAQYTNKLISLKGTIQQ